MTIDQRLLEMQRLLGLLIGEARRAARPDITGVPVSAMDFRALQRSRKQRASHLPAPIFGEPSWDMLLDMTAATLEGRPVSVSSLCHASLAPATTALRHIERLTALGLLHRHSDGQDGRRVMLRLDDGACDAMLAWAGPAMAQLRAAGPAPVATPR
jgi:hypothetical protein